MSAEKQDNKLMIRCPCCQQRFKVKQELKDRMVECGVCDWRFQVTEDVIVKGRKFYPGESKVSGPERFQRISAAPVNMTSAVEIPGMYESPPPQRVIAGILGVVFMLIIGLLLIFGSDYGGPFDGMDRTRRLIITTFAAVLGFALIVYANKGRRVRAGLIAGVCGIGLASLPFFLTTRIQQPGDAPDPLAEMIREPVAGEEEQLTPEERKLAEISARIRLGPLEREIERLKSTGSEERAYGIYLVGLQEGNRIAVRDYMFRVASPDPTSHIYPRDEGHYLMVITGLRMSIDRLAMLADPLGQVGAIIPELAVVEVHVDNGIFIEANHEKLIGRGSHEFYELNLRELESINLERIERAVMRLADVEPRVYRADITRRLRELLGESGVTFHGVIARALRTWDEDVAGRAVLASATAIRLHDHDDDVPQALVSLALPNPDPALLPVLVAQWRDNALDWESLCIAAGPAIEKWMLEEFAESQRSARQSAARILGHIGGRASRQALAAALEDADGETALVIEQALDSMTDRLGGE